MGVETIQMQLKTKLTRVAPARLPSGGSHYSILEGILEGSIAKTNPTMAKVHTP